MKLFIVLLSLLLCSCATGNHRSSQYNRQMVAQANEILDKSINRKTLVVRTKWPTERFFEEQRFLIIKTNGHLYAYDEGGTVTLYGTDEDPMTLADQLTKYAYEAHYE